MLIKSKIWDIAWLARPHSLNTSDASNWPKPTHHVPLHFLSFTFTNVFFSLKLFTNNKYLFTYNNIFFIYNI